MTKKRLTLALGGILIIFLSLNIIGCSGGSGTEDPTESITISYSGIEASYYVESGITDIVPTIEGTALIYSIEPVLENGLSFDNATGIISGTPSSVSNTSHVVTVTNSDDVSDDADVIINVVNFSLSYSNQDPSYIQGCEIPSNIKTITPDTDSYHNYSATGLPDGLDIDEVTGEITGTPDDLQAKTVCTVTGENSYGNTTVAIEIAVVADIGRPKDLNYTSPVTYYTNTPISNNTESHTSGNIFEFTVVGSNPLPDGLSIDPTTGAIYGTPSALPQVETIVTVRACNSCSACDEKDIAITVECDGTEPSGLSYPTTDGDYVINTTITPNTPSISGTVTSYDINDTLPAGMEFNTTTGTISGTPLVFQETKSYSVTATYSCSGTTTTTEISITVQCPGTEPSGLSYPTTDGDYVINTTITPNTPSISGTVTSYDINDTLPAGMEFNSTTGTISGAPTAAQVSKSYSVTATYACLGTSITTDISITVTIPPCGFVYKCVEGLYYGARHCTDMLESDGWDQTSANTHCAVMDDEQKPAIRVDCTQACNYTVFPSDATPKDLRCNGSFNPGSGVLPAYYYLPSAFPPAICKSFMGGIPSSPGSDSFGVDTYLWLPY